MAGYYNRALRSSDRRYAKVLEKMGYGRRDMVAEPKAVKPKPAPAPTPAPAQEPEFAENKTLSDLTALRAEYQNVIGKRPYHGWSAERLQKKIDEAKQAKPDTDDSSEG